MQIEDVTDLAIYGAKLIRFSRFEDSRGYFTEPYRESQLQEVLPGFRCVQMNQSRSRANVLRGLHWQSDPPMGKLVRVISGEMYDLLLDVRRESPTFGKRLSIHMRNGEWIWVPPCVAHGNYFPVETVIEYLCTAEYNKDGEHAICATGEFFFGGEYIVSEKDKTSPSFEEWRASCES